MINGNNYQALTHNGISQLFSEPFERQEFIIQVIQVFPPREDNFVVLLSDGFTWIKGQLLDEAKEHARKINLNKYTVIKFLAEDIYMNSNLCSFELYNFEVANSKINNLIGQPVPYNDFQKKKSFINFQSGNMISNKRCISLREVKKMPVGKISGTILAKIVKKPDKINTVMNIRIEDEEKEEIQCCFFGEEVTKYRDILHWGQWYYFEDPVLQINNKFGNIIELKINHQSKVIKEKKTEEIQPGIINNNNKKKPWQEYEKKPKEHAQLKEFVMRNYKGKESVEEFDLFVIARPLKVFVMKNDQGRNFECVNKHGEIIEILMWSDCKAEIELGKTYRFDFVRVKVFRQKITLQSQRGKTQLTPSSVRILSRDQYFGNKKTAQRKPSSRKVKQRFLGSNEIIYSVAQMIQRCQTSKNNKIFMLCCGSITLRFDNANANHYQAYNDLRKKVFFVKCQKCQENDYVRSKIELTSMNGKVVCNGCKSQKVEIMWNIQALFMDSCAEIPCKINTQVAEKLLDMTPEEGMLLFMQNCEELKLLLQRKLNFKRGVFKFSSKSNEKKEGQRFYNIWEYYHDGSKIYVERGINQLKRTWALFKQTYGLQDKENVDHQGKEDDQQIRMSERLDRIQLREDESEN